MKERCCAGVLLKFWTELDTIPHIQDGLLKMQTFLFTLNTLHTKTYNITISNHWCHNLMSMMAVAQKIQLQNWIQKLNKNARITFHQPNYILFYKFVKFTNIFLDNARPVSLDVIIEIACTGSKRFHLFKKCLCVSSFYCRYYRFGRRRTMITSQTSMKLLHTFWRPQCRVC